jgi:hypothetical protein
MVSDERVLIIARGAVSSSGATSAETFDLVVYMSRGDYQKFERSQSLSSEAYFRCSFDSPSERDAEARYHRLHNLKYKKNLRNRWNKTHAPQVCPLDRNFGRLHASATIPVDRVPGRLVPECADLLLFRSRWSACIHTSIGVQCALAAECTAGGI